jgi:hypothetical protein|tara:strand:+ start:173 stop:361 length:189 start_codon:yes stop_codon:yes gene_type:complete
MSKDDQREKIAEDIRQYLAGGGQVTKLTWGQSAQDKNGKLPISVFDESRMRGPSISFANKKS